MRGIGATDAGLQRDQNEDRFLVDEARGLFCVIDGVGGHAGGERASAIALDLIATRLLRETGSPAERLREAIALANNAILDEAHRDPALHGMTCVLTAALVTGSTLTIGHVGDTRLYKIRQGRIQKLTRDHSPVGEREDAGEITEAEAMGHPRRNEVYRDVGAQPHGPDDTDFVDIVESTFEPDAALVLCSDGLSDQVSSASVRRIVEARAAHPEMAAAELIRAANDAGGKDNVTVVVVTGPAFASSPRAGVTPPASAVTAGHTQGGRLRASMRTALLLSAGIVLGLAGAAAALWMLRPDLLTLPAPIVAEDAPVAPRTWRVGLDPDADVASIAEALARAGAGDTIHLAAGDYRERVDITRPVVLEGPRDAVIRPPLGATSPWTAIAVSDTTEVILSGFTVSGAEQQAIATGVLIERSEVSMRDVVVAGATDAAIDVSDGASAALSMVSVHDNPGIGIIARRGSQLDLRHSSVLRNGTVKGHVKPGVHIEDGARATFTGNAIGDNGAAAVTGLPADALAALARDNVVRPLPRPLPAPRRAPTPSAPSTRRP